MENGMTDYQFGSFLALFGFAVKGAMDEPDAAKKDEKLASLYETLQESIKELRG